jgi:hypothetical protein
MIAPSVSSAGRGMGRAIPHCERSRVTLG